jgi:hypothetical protein
VEGLVHVVRAKCGRRSQEALPEKMVIRITGRRALCLFVSCNLRGACTTHIGIWEPVSP